MDLKEHKELIDSSKRVLELVEQKQKEVQSLNKYLNSNKEELYSGQRNNAKEEIKTLSIDIKRLKRSYSQMIQSTAELTKLF